VFLRVSLTEQAIVVVDAEWTNDHSRAGAVCATPIEGIVASQKANRCTAEIARARAENLTLERCRTPKVVLVGELGPLARKRGTNAGAHSKLRCSGPKGAHVTAALEPDAAEQGVELPERAARPSFKVKPVAGIAICVDPELYDGLRGARSIVVGGASRDVPRHLGLRRLLLAELASTGAGSRHFPPPVCRPTA